jgi:hypothetical protein
LAISADLPGQDGTGVAFGELDLVLSSELLAILSQHYLRAPTQQRRQRCSDRALVPTAAPAVAGGIHVAAAFD